MRQFVRRKPQSVADAFDELVTILPSPLIGDAQRRQAETTCSDAGHVTLIGSIGQISKMQRILDNDADYVEPLDMIAELREDNQSLTARMREAHELCDQHGDIATASMIEVWVDQTERRTWFLFEISRAGAPRH